MQPNTTAGQSLIVEGDTPLDRLEAESADGERFAIFFNPAAHLGRLNALFPPDP